MERCTLLWAAEQAKREFQEKKEVFCTNCTLRNLPGPLYCLKEAPCEEAEIHFFFFIFQAVSQNDYNVGHFPLL